MGVIRASSNPSAAPTFSFSTTSQVLTLGSGVTIDVQGYAQISGSSYSGDGIINEGVIDAY